MNDGRVRASGQLPRLQWAGVSVALAGETVSGDMHVVCPFTGGILLGVVDALGHGPEAAFAAKVAVATLERYAGDPLLPLFKRCHEMLTKTRGVVAALGSLGLDDSVLTWAAVGNIEGLIVRADGRTPQECVVQYGGVVGYRLPKLSSASQVRLEAGDRVVFTTDGLNNGYGELLRRSAPLPELADLVVKRCIKGTDDALILIAEYGGASP